jgi:serine/threonine protein kinase
MSKFLGSGTYGYVYKPPPFLCETSGNLIPSKKYIGKMAIQSNDLNLKIVQGLQQKRKKMDPQGKYSVPYVGYCKKTAHNRKQWDSILQTNKITFKPNIEFIYEYGGKSWNNIKFKPTRECVRLLFLSFRNIVYGLRAMKDLELAHMDIKTANIVYDIDTNTSKLIDYDFLTDKKSMFTSFQKNHDWDVVYFVWPPDVNYILNEPNSLEKLPEYEIRETFILDIKNQKILDYIVADILDYRDYFYPDKVVSFEKIDIYSLGLVFAILFGQVDKDIWNLTKRMIRADPVYRIDTETLLTEYEKLYNKFKTEFLKIVNI